MTGRDSDSSAAGDDTDTTTEDVTRSDPASIVVADVARSFDDLDVLDSVSLTVDPGEFVGLVGPNGAGKTTLLRAISGAIEPDSGSVTIDGVDVHGASSRESSRLVAVVPQDTTLSFSFPVEDVVEMGRHPHRSRFSPPAPADREAVERALERTRTAELAERPIDEISGGQRQRVVLARAIAQATPALLLDEPTASLDINHQIETLELVRELVADGKTAVAAIHDLNLAARYCDRLALLADGNIRAVGPPSEVLTADALGDAFDATATVATNPITGTETVTALPNGEDGSGRTDDSNADADADGEGEGEGDVEHPLRIHVLGTGAIAAAVLARLETSTAALELSTGPITAGDTAAETARSLELDVLEVTPFESLSPTALTAFEARVRASDVTVVTGRVLDRAGDSGTSGTNRLVEIVDATADSIVVVTQPDGETAQAAIDAAFRAKPGPGPSPFANRERPTEVTPESILDAIADEFPLSQASDASSGAD